MNSLLFSLQTFSPLKTWLHQRWVSGDRLWQRGASAAPSVLVLESGMREPVLPLPAAAATSLLCIWAKGSSRGRARPLPRTLHWPGLGRGAGGAGAGRGRDRDSLCTVLTAHPHPLVVSLGHVTQRVGGKGRFWRVGTCCTRQSWQGGGARPGRGGHHCCAVTGCWAPAQLTCCRQTSRAKSVQ